ncbi:hypothetical protein ABID82_000399 [Methylobacterium sp. PvP062]|jgi:Domain of unknown function (DUF3597)|uniref:DUF3597 domain-containing protein n=3 Tax=Methylobacterium radiotolerans TaxID=31998 RepID=B1LZP5_METRJ|nr:MULTISPECIES: DUF3597 domain-containing protein [Methylobacterium]MCX7332329.1 DUF3597 domain-containing protein [Hyphomicrobiales bacterium]GAN49138.1 hypothetical protein ME121_3162 [Methylobacterium sp. ME121]ACB22943.1 conserved hypothetical protein [Methylobacterium radiotolerans JCM 2831]KTS00701.1 hypothetical protein SB3_30180 [Methylobacterium radiotolerans]KTS43864.1 hypothetical protein SB2_26400 [Methylobacterium radiotolerans]
MSLLGSIVSKILHPFGGGTADAAPAPNAGSGGPAGTSTPSTPSAPGTAGGSEPVDVEAVLTSLAEKNPQKLDWRHSIVDLMKLLGLDSGLASRKQLADELHYTGDKDDSASMNIWLHKQVMQKLAENGGKVPDDLKH